MTVYVVVLIILALSGIALKTKEVQNEKKIYAVISFILLGGLAAIRKYTVGNDLQVFYYGMFKKCVGMQWRDFLAANSRIEPGFLMFFKGLSLVSGNPQFMIAVHSVITIGIFVIFMYKHCEDLPLATFLFVTFNQWFQCMVIMRQILAVVITLIALEILNSPSKYKGKYILVLLLNALAMSFHYSAIVVVAFIVIKQLKFTPKRFLLFAFLCTTLFLSLNELGWFLDFVKRVLSFGGIVGRKYSYFSSHILKDARYTTSGIYGFVPFLLTFLAGGVVLYHWRVRITIRPRRHNEIEHIQCKERKYIFDNDFLMYSLLVVVIFKLLSFRVPIFARFAHYFIPLEYILIGRVLGQMKSAHLRRFVVVGIYVITAIAFYFMNADIRLNHIMTGTVPYLPFWR